MSREPIPARQLILDLARAPSFAPDDFLVAPSNADAHELIVRWPDWPNRTLLLVGPPGSGKSHLAAIWRARSGARSLDATQTCVASLRDAPILACLEDADRAAIEEASVFHLLNAVVETSGSLLVTARRPPDLWGLQTRDLLSRLRLAPCVRLGQPDPGLVKAVIVKLFADRQILISEDVVAYAALHCDQSLAAVAAFVSAVDEEALAAGRRITRPLAARTLDRLREGGDQGPT